MPLHPSQKDMKMLEVLYSKKKFNELEVTANKLIQKYPNIAPLMNILGFALHKQGNFKKAIISYEQAIAINPKFVFAHNNLGNVLSLVGDNINSIDLVEMGSALGVHSGPKSFGAGIQKIIDE